MTTKEALIAARKLIEREECWTRDARARNAEGDIVPAKSLDAVCWCASGAIGHVADPEDAARAESHLRSLCAESSVAYFNDRYGHAMVIDLFDRAIAAA